ncbi:MAG: TlpA family protein disulfide reductase [Planctomycetes bacterium]|nr:TlpA family protein disulfide reductase [Planctomycetota bacterium]
MCRRKCRLAKAVMAVAALALAMPLLLRAGDVPSAESAKEEREMVERIDKLSASLRTDLPFQVRLTVNAGQLREIMSIADDFLKRYPRSQARDRVLVAKLLALSELSRMRPVYLEQLIALTQEISSGQPTGPLASECAFCSIQAFILVARRENMTQERRIQGAIERYRAFLDDFPRSHRRAIVRASLIRNLLAAHLTEEAQGEVNRLKREFPDHPATRRAGGELFRVTAVGRPFELQLTEPDGKVVNTADFKGKVVVLHFWSSTNSFALDGLETLKKLHASFQGKGLVLIGVNVDRDLSSFKQTLAELKLPWRQHFESGGISSEILVRMGVIRLPTYFVIDRGGVLRQTEARKKLRETIIELLQEEAAPRPSRTPG